ncbi:unnamed protein product [Echinostoma caproni]|uniref:Rab9 effector protein with kelch motifs n=1 Tax=Echinostoma caproni TaxID=27848 RepID=A0A183ARS8_9TREM|nr:unnamed protein product [Echinostoma caproni]
MLRLIWGNITFNPVNEPKKQHLEEQMEMVSHEKSDRIPSARVGHTAHAINQKSSSSQSIILLGGANLEGTLNEAFLYSTSDDKWSPLNWTDVSDGPLLSRYEHSSAVLPDGEVFVFGGATQSGPLGDIFRLLLSEESPEKSNPSVNSLSLSVSDLGSSSLFPGKSRTQHGSACLTEYGQIVVFAGGAMGSQPVSDNQLYMYDTKLQSWLIVQTSGQGPSVRFGHLLLYQHPVEEAPDDTVRLHIPRGHILIHGGMAEDNFFGDFYQFQFSNLRHTHLRPTVVVFRDLKEAFDSVDRESLMSSFLLEVMPQNYMDVLSSH